LIWEKASSIGFRQFAHTLGLAGRQIVRRHDIVRRQGRDERVPDVDRKGFAVHRTLQNRGRDQSVAEPASGDDGGLPVSKADLGQQPLGA
jgi:hypothetical protein